MSRVTKQQLQAEVEQLRAECDRLRSENTALRSQHVHTPTTDRRAAMAAAKEMAMRFGRVVKV